VLSLFVFTHFPDIKLLRIFTGNFLEARSQSRLGDVARHPKTVAATKRLR